MVSRGKATGVRDRRQVIDQTRRIAVAHLLRSFDSRNLANVFVDNKSALLLAINTVFSPARANQNTWSTFQPRCENP